MDYIFETYEHKDVEEIVSYLLKLWPHGQIQAGDVEDKWWPLFQMGQDIARNHEFFIYEDEEAARSWNKDGRTNSNDKEMVHVIRDEESLTLVCPNEIGDKLKAHIEKARGDRMAHEFIELKLQRAHARCIRSQVRRSILGWLDGTLNNHHHEGMAKMFDMKLRPPRFLKRLLKAVDEIDLENED